MRTMLLVLALGEAAAAAPAPDFQREGAPIPVVHSDLVASDVVTPIEPSEVVMFPLDSTTLRANAVDQVDRTAAWMRANPAYSVVIEAYADESADPTRNAGLSYTRAAAVRSRLAQDGVAGERVVLVAFGDRRNKDGQVALYATRLPGKAIASDAVRRGAARATFVYAGSTFDMVPGT